MKFINLQLFATATIETGHTLASTQPTYLNTNVTTDSGLSPEMKTFYDLRLIDIAGPNLVYDQFGQKRPIPQGNGKTVEFRAFVPLKNVTAALTEGITPTGDKLNVSSKTATVAQYGNYITQSDMLEMTAIDDTILNATKILGDQAGNSLDCIVRDQIVGGSQVLFADTWSGTTPTEVKSRDALNTTAALKVETIERAVAMLQAQNAPKINGDYVAIIHPYVAYDIRRDPEFVEWHKYAQPEELYNGEIGKIAGVRFVQTTNAKVVELEYTVKSYASTTLTVEETITSAGATALAALSEKKLVKGTTEIAFSAAGAAEHGTFTVASGLSLSAGDKLIVKGVKVFCTLIVGEGAYGVTEITGGGLQTFVEQLGSGGTADPLHQRSTVGWKATKTAEILVDEYMVRIESMSSRWNASVSAN